MSGEVAEQLTIFRAEAIPSWSHKDDSEAETLAVMTTTKKATMILKFTSTLPGIIRTFVVCDCFPCWYWNTNDVSEDTLIF
jgi:hypothetical protein